MEIQRLEEITFVDYIYSSNSIEEEGYMYVCVEARLLESDGKIRDIIGESSIILFDSAWENDSYIGVADAIDQEKHDLMVEADNFFELENFRRIAVLDKLYIKEDYQNKGYGTELLGSIKEYLMEVLHVEAVLLLAASIKNGATGAEKILLDEKVKEFYRKNGYTQFTDKNFYIVDEDLDDFLIYRE